MSCKCNKCLEGGFIDSMGRKPPRPLSWEDNFVHYGKILEVRTGIFYRIIVSGEDT